MANFFQQAPAQDTFQKRFIESILHKQSIVGSFPQNYAVASLYPFPAMLDQGVAVAVCPNRYSIQRNVSWLNGLGLDFPAVAVLDGGQMPHQEREILSHINHRRVQLLYTTAERFASLGFLQILAREPVKFIVVEQAQWLLPGFYGSRQYQKLWDTFHTLERRPPLVLLTQPLGEAPLHRLTKRLQLQDFQLIRKEPLLEKTRLRVQCRVTEHQKLRALVRSLLTPLPRPGSVLVQTADTLTCEKLAHALKQRGVGEVLTYHGKLSPEERIVVEQTFHQEPYTVVVATAEESRFLKPPRMQGLRRFLWHPPLSLEELVGQAFGSIHSEDAPQEVVVLYTKEDYERALKTHPQAVAEIKRLRQWVLAGGCRFQTLVADWQGLPVGEIPRCGTCDGCQPRSFGGEIRAILKHWLY